MTQTIQLIAIGDGLGLVLTPDLVEQLGGRPGGSVTVAVVDGGLHLRNADEAAQTEQMRVAERVMREDRDILSRLAK